MRRLHLIVGLVFVVVFLLSGQYMHFGHDHLRGYDDTRRLLFRSTHIYLLLAALLNLALGLYLKPEATGWRRWQQTVGSLLILLAPPLLALSFWYEPWLTDLERPYSRPGNYACFGGMMLHLLSQWPRRDESHGDEVKPE